MNLKKKTTLIVCGTSPLDADFIKGFTLSGATVTATARASGRPAVDALETAASVVDLDLENPLSIDACVHQLTSGKKSISWSLSVAICWGNRWNNMMTKKSRQTSPLM